ncbi:MAG TPA: putative collagen-binding domain-containing protein, partial [Candidatus Deferrimicrobium sp.]|nr:putative collagen-binding domain-containing protein [Candidatus Deferrimicrobium sp.]
HDASGQQLRRQAWWPMLCGAFGQVMGNDPLFWFGPGWRAELDSPGTRAMQVWRSFWEPLPWWRLVPDVEGRLVTGWRGAVAGLERVTGARTDDGELAVVYVPVARSIEVDLGQLRGPLVAATWFDSASGATVDAGRHPASGVVTLLAPYPEDAALLLRSVDTRSWDGVSPSSG